MTVKDARAKIEGMQGGSAWKKGVRLYAVEMLGSLPDDKELPVVGLREALLNGANDWHQYSYGGCALVNDCDIAERLLSPSILARRNGGDLPPSYGNTWLDEQARALAQAYLLIKDIID